MTAETKKYKPVVLVIMDGFGVNIDSPNSTWKYAAMPNIKSLEEAFPFTTIQASGIAVGLPWGEPGNSEVGHLTLGAGKALYHHLPRIITAIEDGTFFKNPAFLGAKDHIAKTSGALHLMGLFSSGSVHAYADHLYALLEFVKKENISRVYLHLFTDGKDAPPKEARSVISELKERLAKKYPFAEIASLAGRFYAMDRDNNWDRIEKTYLCLAENIGSAFQNPLDYIEEAYQKNLQDGAIEPAGNGAAESRIKAGDSVIFYNFREDSERELVAAFTAENFKEFERKKIENLYFVTMTEYDKQFPVHVAFPPLDINWPLSRVIADAGLKQLHIAETEKYAHVTYFFNGGKEQPFKGEDRVLIHSPHAAHFEEIPQMSAHEITNAALENLQKYDFILVNFANADMVGHTGNLDATVKALEILDECVGKIAAKTLELDGAMMLTADHGNAEEKIYAASGEKRTQHTSNPVPFFVIRNDLRRETARTQNQIKELYETPSGVITDVAPTVIALLGINKPVEMTGVNLLTSLEKEL